MTPSQIKTTRKLAAPDMTQANFARALGYVDADAYRKYESGARQAPPLLRRLMDMIERHGMPDDLSAWMDDTV